MATKKSIFTSEKEKTTTLSTKVPESLKDRIDVVNGKLKKVAPGKTFNISSILSDAITDAVDQAEKELTKIDDEGSTKEEGNPQTSNHSRAEEFQTESAEA